MRSAIHTLTDAVCDLITHGIDHMRRLHLWWQLDRSQSCEAAYVKAVAEYDAAILCATMGGRNTIGLQVSRTIYADMLALEREYQRHIYSALLNAGAFPVLNGVCNADH